MKIACNLILRSENCEDKNTGWHSELDINIDDPYYLEHIKKHIEIFRKIISEQCTNE